MTHRHQLSDLKTGVGDLTEATEWIRSADRILIGAGAGLSASAGYDYGDSARFRDLFPALTAAGFMARYELIGHPLPPRHQWGFWAVHVDDIRFGEAPNETYQGLRRLVGDREHFVLSSNVDALFTRNGFNASRVDTPQGDYGLYQCRTPCTRKVWDSRPILERALAEYDADTGQTSEAAVPSCPNCGGEVYLNVYAGAWYINDHFQPGLWALRAWLDHARSSGESMAIIDIGSGFNTPSVIRWPMESVAAALPNSRLIRINRDHAGVPRQLVERAASLDGDAAAILADLSTEERTAR